MTVLEAIQRSSDFLAKKGVESPRLQSELLLAHVLKTQRLKLYLDFARNLAESETGTLRELVKRRGNREPLQHILGSTSFCGLEIKVNYNVLVPRPETELLAEEGWKFLNSLQVEEPCFLDFGTGSGCIALALAHFSTKSRGWALEKSNEALGVAKENAIINQVQSRIEFVQSDGFSALNKSSRFHLIISNPPYIPANEIATLQDEVRKYDPHSALDGGSDGLEFYRLLSSQAGAFLESAGKMIVEFGDGQEGAVAEIFRGNSWRVEAIKNDYTDRPRMLAASRPS